MYEPAPEPVAAFEPAAEPVAEPEPAPPSADVWQEPVPEPAAPVDDWKATVPPPVVPVNAPAPPITGYPLGRNRGIDCF